MAFSALQETNAELFLLIKLRL